jgi:hypothetical protein
VGLAQPAEHDLLVKCRTNLLFNDFNDYTSGGLFTSGTTGGGASVANNDGDGGILTLTTGATQNNEAWVATTRKLYTFQAGRAYRFQCELAYTEGSVNQAAIAFGFCSAFGAGMLVDTTFVPVSTFSGTIIYKVPGETVWRACTSIGTTQSVSQSVNTTIQPGLNQRMVIQAQIVQANLEVTFWTGTTGVTANTGSVGATTGGINLSGMQPLLLNFNNTGIAQRGIPVKHTVAYSGAVAMFAGAFMKSGAAGGVSEVGKLDYLATEYLCRP